MNRRCVWSLRANTWEGWLTLKPRFPHWAITKRRCRLWGFLQGTISIDWSHQRILIGGGGARRTIRIQKDRWKASSHPGRTRQEGGVLQGTNFLQDGDPGRLQKTMPHPLNLSSSLTGCHLMTDLRLHYCDKIISPRVFREMVNFSLFLMSRTWRQNTLLVDLSIWQVPFNNGWRLFFSVSMNKTHLCLWCISMYIAMCKRARQNSISKFHFC